jgi:transcriptional regulator with XRE-family HTH domain
MPQDIADNIRRIMEERGVDASVLAERLGYSNRAMVDHWLSGRRIPTHESIQRVAEVLKVAVGEIDPLNSAYKHTGPRTKSHGVDNAVEVSKIPYSQQPPTTTEGPMSDQVRRLEGALLQIPEEHRDEFVRRVSLTQARFLLELEEPGISPGKRARGSGKG